MIQEKCSEIYDLVKWITCDLFFQKMYYRVDEDIMEPLVTAENDTDVVNTDSIYTLGMA